MSSTLPAPAGRQSYSAPFSASSSGDNLIVAGTAGLNIVVTGLVLFPTSAVNVYWKSGTSGTGSNTVIWPSASAIGLCSTSQPTGMGLGYNPVGWFETTTAGDGLYLNLSSGVTVNGLLTYMLV